MAYGTWSSGTTASTSTGTSYDASRFRTMQWNHQPSADTNPVLRGVGPAECSSCTELATLPLAIFDVNGYYRELGVHPKATRRQLREAYRERVGALQNGQDAARLTYVLRQLLDPETRFAYDCTPLGEVFMDRYVQDMLNRRMRLQMSERMARLHDMGVDLDGVDQEAVQRDILAEMGYQEADDDTPSETVAESPMLGKDDDRPAKFEYSYYLWSTRPREDSVHLGRLAEWQRVLVSAFAREGVNLKFAVGFHGQPHRWVQALVGYRTVFFLNVNTEPDESLASDVARQVRRDREQ